MDLDPLPLCPVSALLGRSKLASNFLLIILRIHRRGGGYPPTHPHSAVKYKIFNNKIKIKLTAEGVCRTSYKVLSPECRGDPPARGKFCRMICIPLPRSLYFISAIKYNKVDRRIRVGGGVPTPPSAIRSRKQKKLPT